MSAIRSYTRAWWYGSRALAVSVFGPPDAAAEKKGRRGGGRGDDGRDDDDDDGGGVRGGTGREEGWPLLSMRGTRRREARTGGRTAIVGDGRYLCSYVRMYICMYVSRSQCFSSD